MEGGGRDEREQHLSQPAYHLNQLSVCKLSESLPQSVIQQGPVRFDGDLQINNHYMHHHQI